MSVMFTVHFCLFHFCILSTLLAMAMREKEREREAPHDRKGAVCLECLHSLFQSSLHLKYFSVISSAEIEGVSEHAE